MKNNNWTLGHPPAASHALLLPYKADPTVPLDPFLMFPRALPLRRLHIPRLQMDDPAYSEITDANLPSDFVSTLFFCKISVSLQSFNIFSVLHGEFAP